MNILKKLSFTAKVLVLGGSSLAFSLSANANIIDATYGAGAGSFELGNFINGGGTPNSWGGVDFMGVQPGDNTTITGWTVGGPGDGIDWLITPGYGADTGVHAIDLQHLTASSISTVITTTIGQQYLLSFSSAAVPSRTAIGTVSAGSLINQIFAPTLSTNARQQVFTPFSFLFTATQTSTTITFASTNPSSNYGPVLDSVSVVQASAISEPGSLLFLGLGVLGMVGVKRRIAS